MPDYSSSPHWKRHLSPRFLIGKVRAKGIIWCVKTGIYRVGRRCFYPVSRIVRRLSWVFPSLRFLLRTTSQSEKRILAIWDFKTVPYTIGELLVLHEVTLILCWIYKIKKVDIAFVCDPANPARSDQGLNSYDYHYHLSALTQVVQVNPRLGSFFLFDSYSQLEKYIEENIEIYATVWPTGKDYVSGKRAYIQHFGLIEQFYRENNFIPHLSCRPIMLDWAHSFFSKYVLPDIAVVVQLRNNPKMQHALDRNANIDEWLGFFKYCVGRLPVKFVVISTHDEIDDRLRDYSNVLVAKDYHTTIEQDLALIQTSAMFMGGPSGPNAMALFSNLPCVIVNFHPGNERIEWDSQLIFASDTQKLIWKPETTAMLIEEFGVLFNRLDAASWQQKCRKSPAFRESSFKLR